ncbi:hypothetical protein GOE04_17605 [Sinorhizobium medicae]|nr:hypothetical protein [Sinorhizobium medicae]MDX0921374.1 hypothetical protein [Sinorhizobium medicae]MDX0935247.1 hypothetical protein [Sinorhizobium medicae]MDX0941594.1 hypothetical protein [Sinorhizobium medicae]MDX1027642.1 hypothetical protein [Sinorhizobium medicae]
MTFCKRTIIISLTWAAGLCIGDLERDQSIVSIPSFVSSAVAKVGRPLTPVSVAGVARRTTRRCAAGVYNC